MVSPDIPITTGDSHMTTSLFGLQKYLVRFIAPDLLQQNKYVWCPQISTGKLGAEVQAIPMPLCIDTNDVIEPRFLRRRLYVLWLKNRLDDFVRFCCNFIPYRIRYAWSRTGTVYPLSWYFCHIHIFQSLRPLTVFCELTPIINGWLSLVFIMLSPILWMSLLLPKLDYISL